MSRGGQENGKRNLGAWGPSLSCGFSPRDGLLRQRQRVKARLLWVAAAAGSWRRKDRHAWAAWVLPLTPCAKRCAQKPFKILFFRDCRDAAFGALGKTFGGLKGSEKTVWCPALPKAWGRCPLAFGRIRKAQAFRQDVASKVLFFAFKSLLCHVFGSGWAHSKGNAKLAALLGAACRFSAQELMEAEGGVGLVNSYCHSETALCHCVEILCVFQVGFLKVEDSVSSPDSGRGWWWLGDGHRGSVISRTSVRFFVAGGEEKTGCLSHFKTGPCVLALFQGFLTILRNIGQHYGACLPAGCTGCV